MKRFAIIALLVGLAFSAPASKESAESDKIVVNSGFFLDAFLKHTAEHDIIKITVPLNELNFDDDENEEEYEIDDDDDADTPSVNILFFVEADLSNGVEYKGLSVITGNKTTKILESGTDIAVELGEAKAVYFSATDGLYSYDAKENKAVKYGTITDNIISFVKVNETDLFYIVTSNHELFKVTEAGTTKAKVDQVQGPVEAVEIDYVGDVFFYGPDKEIHVLSDGGVKKIEGLPANPSYVSLLKPPFVMDEGGLPCVVDNKAYLIYANGTSEVTDFEFEVRPTAYAMEAALIQYYAHDRKIYEFNVLAIIMGEILAELKAYIAEKSFDLEGLATRSVVNELKA